MSVIGKLGNTKTKVFIDIGVGDAVRATEITMELMGTEKAPLFEKEIHLWAYPVESIFAEKLETAVARADQNSRMKDYHDLILLVRGDVVDKKAAKAAIKATFKNRGTDLQLFSIPKDQLETLQKYWGLYLKAADEAVQRNLDTDIQVNINEINEYLISNGLVQE